MLSQAYGQKDQVTDELIEAVLKPGLQPGAVDVFLDFVSYSSGPLPEDLIAACPVRCLAQLWGGQLSVVRLCGQGTAARSRAVGALMHTWPACVGQPDRVCILPHVPAGIAWLSPCPPDPSRAAPPR